MPITVASELVVLTQEEFHAIDRRVMGLVFDVHNEFGRLLDEKHFHGGPKVACPLVEILDGDAVIGSQDISLLTPEIAIACTALTHEPHYLKAVAV